MKTKYYECRAIDDVVLRMRASTEGKNESLQHIPGNVFLGIAAKEYKTFSNSFDIFHSGEVVFADGHLSRSGYRSLKTPLTWFHEKGVEYKNNGKLLSDNITIFHGSEDGVENQKKQIRNLFFFADGTLANCKDSYSLKSAYDLDKRKSKDRNMYGYHSIPAGTKWIFYVKGKEQYLEEIDKVLQGRHSIGKSKTSQYGRIAIKAIENHVPSWQHGKLGQDKLLYVYAKSYLSFVNEYGEATYTPSEDDFALKDKATICWERSQIRPYSYAIYNRVREARDADRVCIDKGSVIVLKAKEDFTESDYASWLTQLESGIGEYKNEGMGQVLVNPDFITKENPIFRELSLSSAATSVFCSAQDNHDSDEKIVNWLQHQAAKSELTKMVGEKVNDFIQKHLSKFVAKSSSNITPSQWGSIRARVHRFSTYEKLSEALFVEKKQEDKKKQDNESGYLVHGKMKSLWQKNDRVGILQDAVRNIYEQANKDTKDILVQTFLVELCSEMAKRSRKGA